MNHRKQLIAVPAAIQAKLTDTIPPKTQNGFIRLEGKPRRAKTRALAQAREKFRKPVVSVQSVTLDDLP